MDRLRIFRMVLAGGVMIAAATIGGCGGGAGPAAVIEADYQGEPAVTSTPAQGESADAMLLFDPVTPATSGAMAAVQRD